MPIEVFCKCSSHPNCVFALPCQCECQWQYSIAFLIQKEGPNPGRQFNITKDEIEVGSAISNDLILKDSTISNKHARIKKVKGTFYIYDIVSQRGTFVNGKKVLKPKPLSDFDEIRLGRTLLLFRGKWDDL